MPNRVIHGRPPAWCPTQAPVQGAWNVMVLDDGRDVERYVCHIEGGMIHCEDGTSFHDAQVVRQWVRWADLPDDEQVEYRF